MFEIDTGFGISETTEVGDKEVNTDEYLVWEFLDHGGG